MNWKIKLEEFKMSETVQSGDDGESATETSQVRQKVSLVKEINNIYNPIINLLKDYRKKASNLKIPGIPDSSEFDSLITDITKLKEQYKHASKKVKKHSDTKSGFAQPVFITHEFAQFCNDHMQLGVTLPKTSKRYPVLTRSLITKIITHYIESHKLKHPEHKRYIVYDDVLLGLFGKKTLEDFYEDNKGIEEERKSVVKKFDVGTRTGVICFSWSGLQKLARTFVVDIPVEPKSSDTRRIDKISEFFTNN